MSPPFFANNRHVRKRQVLLLAFLRVQGRHVRWLGIMQVWGYYIVKGWPIFYKHQKGVLICIVLSRILFVWS